MLEHPVQSDFDATMAQKLTGLFISQLSQPAEHVRKSGDSAVTKNPPTPPKGTPVRS